MDWSGNTWIPCSFNIQKSVVLLIVTRQVHQNKAVLAVLTLYHKTQRFYIYNPKSTNGYDPKSISSISQFHNLINSEPS